MIRILRALDAADVYRKFVISPVVVFSEKYTFEQRKRSSAFQNPKRELYTKRKGGWQLCSASGQALGLGQHLLMPFPFRGTPEPLYSTGELVLHISIRQSWGILVGIYTPRKWISLKKACWFSLEDVQAGNTTSHTEEFNHGGRYLRQNFFGGQDSSFLISAMCRKKTTGFWRVSGSGKCDNDRPATITLTYRRRWWTRCESSCHDRMLLPSWWISLDFWYMAGLFLQRPSAALWYERPYDRHTKPPVAVLSMLQNYQVGKLISTMLTRQQKDQEYPFHRLGKSLQTLQSAV